MKFKRMLLMGLLLASTLLTGCGSSEAEDVNNSSQSQAEQDVKEDKRENLLKDDVKEETKDNSKEDTVEEPKADTGASKEAADIEALAAECVYNVYWYTEDGPYSAGTSFLMDSEVHGEPLLVSAFHYLWPEDADTFTGSELPDYVSGGEIYNAYTGEFTYASLKNCLIIEDADVIPAIDKDVSAFTIQDGEDLKTLPLAETPAKEGEKVYLLAYLWDTDDVHENCVYEGEVSVVEDGVIYYTLEGKPGTNGASGAPIVNEYGEVVAIHIGSNNMYYAGHTSDSFLKQINNGKLSNVTYAPYEEVEPTEYVYFECDEKVSSMFYDVQIDKVEFTDTLAGEACVEGYQFVLIDVSLSASRRETEPVPMYYSDFALEWEADYCYPLEAGWTDTQLPDEYYITREVTSGQLVFMAPVGEELLFSFIDTYYTDDPNETNLDKYYGIEIPLENWTR